MSRQNPHLARRRLLIAAAAAGLGSLPATPSASATVTLDDRMPVFWRVFERSRELSRSARASALRMQFFEAEASLYRRAGFRPVSNSAVAAWLEQFDPMADAARTLHRRFRDRFGAHLRGFAAQFSDFDPAASPVFLMPSLFHFDAHLEPDGARLPLFFGIDGIVRYHGRDPDLGVLLAHETFHCYQAQRNPALSLDANAPVFAGVWIEGTATYASERLNPGASLRHVLLDDDALLRDGPRTARRVATSLLDRLDSTQGADQSSFLSSGWTGEWPARAGYYVGLLAARQIGRSMSLREMAALPASEVRARLAASLVAIRDEGVVAGR